MMSGSSETSGAEGADRSLPRSKASSLGERAEFDPFLAEPLVLARISNRSSSITLVLAVIVAVLLFAANAIQGSIGPFPSAEGFRDVMFALHLSDVAPARSAYSLTRDLPTMLLATIAVLTVLLTHLQWKRMRAALPSMMQTGAIPNTRRNRAAVFLFVSKSNRAFRWISRATVIWAVTAFFLLLLAMVGGQHAGIFQILAPRGASDSARYAIGQEFYEGWWAGISHPVGFFAYGLVMFIGIYAIVLMNAVGVVTITRLVSFARSGVTFGIDKYNRDGVAGWASWGAVLTTVYVSLISHAVGISVIVFILGFDGWRWIVGLLVIWALVAPTYVLIPLYMFGRRMTAARDRAIADYIDTVEADQTDPGWTSADQAATQLGVKALRDLPTLPLSRFQLVGVIFFQTLPLAFAVLELSLALRV